MLLRPIIHAANTFSNLSCAQDALAALMDACLTKHPAFSIERLSSILNQAERMDPMAGTVLLHSGTDQSNLQLDRLRHLQTCCISSTPLYLNDK